MAEDHHHKLVAIFQAVCDLKPDQRASRLDELCEDDVLLRAELQVLLGRDAKPTGFLARPALETPLEEILPDPVRRLLDSDPSRETDREATLAIGRRMIEHIGGFDLLRLLGEGAAGLVFLARQHHPERMVAIKLIRPGMTTGKMISRFKQEAAILGRLQHPGIAQIHEAGTADAGEGVQPYFVMEFLAGRTLLEYANEHELGTRDRLSLLVKICQAVHHAHQKGVVHRDLKPDNILVIENGQPKILDFGVAHITDSDMQTTTLRTNIGQLIGTIPYMSPEQANGDARELDIRSDVYALGVLGFQLLCGELPHDLRGKKVHEAVRIIRDDDPFRLSTFDRTLQGDVETIVAKALEKDRDRRYPSAWELAQDIERYLHEEPITARPPSTIYKFRMFTRRNRVLVTGTVVVFLVLVLGMIGTSIGLISAKNEAAHARDAEKATEMGAYVAGIAAADAAIRVNDIANARFFLQSTPEHLRNWEWDYIYAHLDRSLGSCTGHTAMVWDVAFSPNGKRLATASRDGTARIWDVATRRELQVLRGHREQVLSVAFHPSGTMLLTGGTDGLLKLWNPRDGRTLRTLKGHTDLVNCARFSPDGKHIASGSYDRTIRFWDAATGQELSRITGHDHWVFSVAFSPGGDRLASTSRDNTIRIWNVEDGAEMLTIQAMPGTEGVMHAWQVVFSPDGRHVAAGLYDGTVRTWDVSTGEPVQILRGHTYYARALKYHPDGLHLISGCVDRTIRVWDLEEGVSTVSYSGHEDSVTSITYDFEGHRAASGDGSGGVKIWETSATDHSSVMRGHGDTVTSLCISQDGRTIVSGARDNTIRIWDRANAATVGKLRGHTDMVTAVEFNREETRILSSSHDGTVRIWDAVTGELLSSLHAHEDYIRGMSVSPDGNTVATCGDDKTIKLWNADSLEAIWTISGLKFSHMKPAFSPDGSLLIAGASNGEVTVWDFETRQIALTLQGHTQCVVSASFSPDGSLIATASEDHTAKLWNASTGELLFTLTGHRSCVFSSEFNPDGTRLLTCSQDHTLRLWDVATGRAMLTMPGHFDRVIAAKWSPDGRWIASTSTDRTIRLWDATPQNETGLYQDVVTQPGNTRRR